MIGQFGSRQAGRGGAILAAVTLVGGLGGCIPTGEESPSLVIATPWPAAARLACAAAYQASSPTRPIRWVELGDHRWLDACDRRGGVDLVLGGPSHQMQRLADAGRLELIDPSDEVPWRQVTRPRPTLAARPIGGGQSDDPRDYAEMLAEAKSTIAASGWGKGYETLVRQPVVSNPAGQGVRPILNAPPEAVALVRSGRHPDQAHRFLAALERQGWIKPSLPDAEVLARTDDLLADLLGAALVDARNERRDALIALGSYHHPAIAEAAVGEPPPWPPASVIKLRADPARAALAESLVEQMLPDPAARAWLKSSWEPPKQAVDLNLLHAICQAEGGRLVREPRFRAWLRGEWTAWTQQLYRRVTRLAGGYRPS